MPSIFDTLFSPTPGALFGTPAPTGQPASMLNPLDPEALRRAQLQDSLTGLSQGLLSAGGPSATPNDFGSAFGKGLSGALAGKDAGEDRFLKRALTGAQVQKAQSEIAADKLLNDAFGASKPAAGSPPMTAATPGPIAAPSGGPSNPTNPGNLANGQGGFQTFKTPEEGVAAAIKLAQQFPTTYNNGQPMTLAQIESHWSPPDNGKDPMTKGNVPGVWSGNVARAMGTDPNTPIDFSNPAMGHAFAKAVHVAEHPPGSAYSPDVYARGAQMAYGAMPQAPVTGSAVAQPPVQLASTPPIAQGDGPQAAPGAQGVPPPVAQAPTPQVAQAAPVGTPAPQKSLQEVINTMPPALRQLAPGMTRQGKLDLLAKYADPGSKPAIDIRTGQIVFAPATELNNGNYAPIEATKVEIEKRQAAAQESQAESRRIQAEIASRNSAVGPDGKPQAAVAAAAGLTEAAKEAERRKAETAQLTDPAFQGGKAGVVGAEENAKLDPEMRRFQAQLAMKDHEQSQIAAASARSSNANLERLQSLLEKVNTGKGTETINDLKATAKAAGFDLPALGIDDNVGVVQAAKALQAKMTLELGSAPDGGLKGSFSDKDVAFLKSGIPGLDSTPEGRRLMVDYMKRVNQRAIDVAAIKNDYARSPAFTKDPLGMFAKVKEYADSHPLFDKESAAPAIRKYNPATGKIE